MSQEPPSSSSYVEPHPKPYTESRSHRRKPKLRQSQNPRPTHFLSLPLLTSTSYPQWRSSLTRLSSSLSDPLLKRAIRPLGTLHLTICVLYLPSKERVTEAVGVLENLDIGALVSSPHGHERQRSEDRNEGNGEGGKKLPPLRIAFKGLGTMRSPKATSNLFAIPLDAEDRIGRFCEGVKRMFAGMEASAGRQGEGNKRGKKQKSEEGKVKLHATVLNTVYLGRLHLPHTKGDSSEATDKSEKPEETTDYQVVTKTSSPNPNSSAAPANTNEDEPTGLEENNNSAAAAAAAAVDVEANELEQILASPQPSPSSSLLHQNPDKLTNKKQSSQNQNQTQPSNRPQKKQILRFDARDILAQHQDFIWTEQIRLEKLSLCEMGAKQREDGGEAYTEIASVPLP